MILWPPLHEHTELNAVLSVLYVLTLIHVWQQSKRLERVGRPLAHTLMVAIVLWPLGYSCWLLWWPGTLRDRLIGSKRERIRRKVKREFAARGR